MYYDNINVIIIIQHVNFQTHMGHGIFLSINSSADVYINSPVQVTITIYSDDVECNSLYLGHLENCRFLFECLW